MPKRQAEVARRRQFRGTGLSWTLVLALVMAAAIVVGVIQKVGLEVGKKVISMRRRLRELMSGWTIWSGTGACP